MKQEVHGPGLMHPTLGRVRLVLVAEGPKRPQETGLTVPQGRTLLFRHSIWERVPMRIKDACATTGLTRKAIRYYESKGLIAPDIDPNGYRDYSQQTVRQLALIAVLRGFHMSIAEIREALHGEQALSTQLAKTIDGLRQQQERVSVELQLLSEFAAGERTAEEIAEVRRHMESSFDDRPGCLGERLREVFPGDFGEVLAAVYGAMLDQRLDTPEEHTAWLSLIADLDAIDPVEVPDGVARWARQSVSENRIDENVARMREEYSQDYESFAQYKREATEQYLSEASAEDVAALTERSKIVTAFLAGPGLPMSLAVGKYLPALSSHFSDFAEKGHRFVQENPGLMDQLMGSEQ